MCCFSQPVALVSDTNIFARSANGRQFLVYSMDYAAATDLAMLLPLPVPPNSPEDAVRFISLEQYPTFFGDMSSGFAPRMAIPASLGLSPQSAPAPRLKVHDVGNFEASFVPRIEDFDRLDKRFRIPREVWCSLPEYLDYGFAVFKLKGAQTPFAGILRKLMRGTLARIYLKPRSVHPMAFEFPIRTSDLLFFPTVHVHDRKVRPLAEFDHTLYFQLDSVGAESNEIDLSWEDCSYSDAERFIDIARSEGIVEPKKRCWRLPLGGSRENKDTWVGKGGYVPKYSAAK